MSEPQQAQFGPPEALPGKDIPEPARWEDTVSETTLVARARDTASWAGGAFPAAGSHIPHHTPRQTEGGLLAERDTLLRILPSAGRRLPAGEGSPGRRRPPLRVPPWAQGAFPDEADTLRILPQTEKASPKRVPPSQVCHRSNSDHQPMAQPKHPSQENPSPMNSPQKILSPRGPLPTFFPAYPSAPDGSDSERGKFPPLLASCSFSHPWKSPFKAPRAFH